ncbi:transcriptional regulator [Desulfocucumis palustris]|uniref:Transcriptional regulator n=1 Tax=Desulfocucumis palustris TaxID=1898651 RepID=A0A2L2XEK8_9FIRM|nr:FCD domain-containing protein [Desulfocucumis palustris]GBF34777.1 transcriptional regulator [Desulfocucumis palustris]
MPAEREKQEFEILSILEEAGEPLGSGQLSQLLNERGLEVSEATVGRILSEMDRKQLTIKLGFQGRVISAGGRDKLQEFRSARHRQKYGNRFIETLKTKKKEDLIDILVARRAIERELARLAALHATDMEISLLEAVLREQEQYTAQKQMTAEQDVRFHRLVAIAAKNRVLAAALDLIRHDGQLSPILEYIRTQVGGKLAVGHGKVLKAIKERDPDEAERAMMEHIESLIADVQKYWSSQEDNI